MRPKYYVMGELPGMGSVQYIGTVLGEVNAEDVFFRIDTAVFENRNPHFPGPAVRLLDEPVVTTIKRALLQPHDAGTDDLYNRARDGS